MIAVTADAQVFRNVVGNVTNYGNHCTIKNVSSIQQSELGGKRIGQRKDTYRETRGAHCGRRDACHSALKSRRAQMQ